LTFDTTDLNAFLVQQLLSDDDEHTAQPYCQNFTKYDKTLQSRKQFSNCVTVDHQDKNTFDVQLCTSKKFCGEGYFMIKRKNARSCKATMEQKLSLDPSLDTYFKKEIGPV
jgi:hypothetical protein